MKTSIGSVNPGRKIPSFLERLAQMPGVMPSKSVTPATSASNAHTSPSNVIGKASSSAGAAAPRIPVKSTADVGTAVASTAVSVAGKASATTGASAASVSAKISSGAGAAVTGAFQKGGSEANTSSAKAGNTAAQSASSGTINPLLTLNDTQHEEAALVDKLPGEFPILQWETLNTKLQQKVMQKSGLSPQEQWQLLNASTPLEILSLVNAAQKSAKSGQLTPREAREVTDRVLRYSAARLQLNSSDASSLPPLQKRFLRGKLDEVFAKLQEESEGGPNVGPKTTPSPSSTPLPRPGPTPAVQPINTVRTNDTTRKITGSSVQSIQRFYETLLHIDTSNLSAGDCKTLELISRQIDSGSFTQSQLNIYYQTLERIRSKVKYLEKAMPGSKSDATWGTEMINNQGSYSYKVGTFGRWGSIAANGCGAIAINNVNQIIGFNTEFGDLVHNLNQYSNLTTNLFGVLGMNPIVVGDYYRRNGAEVTLYTNPADVPTDHDAYIALFFHSGGAHYIAAKYDQSEHEYEVYNLLADGEKKQMDSLSASDYPGMKKTDHWIIWGIDSPVNTNDGYSSSPIEKENQSSRRDS